MNRETRNLAILLGSFGLLLIFLPLRVQPIEPLIYAAAVEHNYDLASTFAEANPAAKLPDFSRFHPNHPLQHALAGVMHDKMGMRALDVLRLLNALAALVALFALYRTLRLLRCRSTHALLATGMTATTLVFWMSALTGEVHMPAFAFACLAGKYLVRYFSHAPRNPRFLFFASLCFAVAGSLHIGALFLALPAVTALAADFLKRNSVAIRWLFLSAMAVVGSLLFVYVFLVAVVLHISSVRQYADLVSIYAHLSYQQFSAGQWLSTILLTYLESLFAGQAVGFMFVKCALLIVALAGSWLFAHSKRTLATKIMFLTAVPFYFASHLVFQVRPDALNGWLFVLPAFSVAMAFSFRYLARWRDFPIAIPLVALVPIAMNSALAILPNATVAMETIHYLNAIKPTVMAEAATTRVVAVAKDPVITFPDLYDFSGGFPDGTVRILWACCGRTSYQATLLDMARNRTAQWFINDDLSGETTGLFDKAGIHYDVVLDREGEIDPRTLPSSIFFRRDPHYRVFKRMQVLHLRPELQAADR